MISIRRAMQGVASALLGVLVLAGCGGDDADDRAEPIRSTTARLEAADVPAVTTSVVTAGANHACAMAASGSVQCWGANWAGQLGDGTTTSSAQPVMVQGLEGGVVAMTAGGSHTCAMTTAGGVKCWGSNWYGELGDGATVSRSTPVDVVGIVERVVSISAGANHTCAVTESGGAKCWGYNSHGQLGFPGVTTGTTTPTDVTNLGTGVRSVHAGQSHTCAVMQSGGVKCWGSNDGGLLGNDSMLNNAVAPVDVVDLGEPVISLDGKHSHVCAVLASGIVKCWGRNDGYQLGAGGISESRRPLTVSGVSGATMVQTGWSHTCAATTPNGARCWGNNSLGQLGDPNAGAQWDVRALPSAFGAAEVWSLAAGGFFNCALVRDGSGVLDVRCWGENENGEVGTPKQVEVLRPVLLSALTTGVTEVSAGDTHTCAMQHGGVRCWGNNNVGQLGDGTYASTTNPTFVAIPGSVRSMSAGAEHACAVSYEGAVYCWGRNWTGALGDGTTVDRALPVMVPGLSDVRSVHAADTYTCAVMMSGAVKCWGYSTSGLGHGGLYSLSPVDVVGFEAGVSAPAAGSFSAHAGRACGITGGGVKCWGSGPLGNGVADASFVPVDVVGLDGPTWAVSVGRERFSCALGSVGGVKCWGDNQYGQLGNDGLAGLYPTVVSGLASDVSAIGAGGRHACAVMSSGGLRCWGANEFGQIGDGTKLARAVPVDVDPFGLGASIVASSVAGGRDHTCAVTGSGAAYCWGVNQFGQVGVESNVHVRSPMSVVGIEFGDSVGPSSATPVMYGTVGNAGWFRSDVTIDWRWVDLGAGIDASRCQATSTSVGEGSAITLSATCYDLVGNVGNLSRVVKVDKTPPVTAITAGPSGSGTGTTATFTFAGSDALSGIDRFECKLDDNPFVAGCSGNAVYGGLAPGVHVFAVRAVDKAGNVEPAAVTRAWTVLAPDVTPPVITPALTGPLGSHGWYRGAVTLDWRVSDDQSPVTATTGCTSQSVTANTAGVTFACTATSSGGTSTQSVTVMVDMTSPTLGVSVSPTTVIQYLQPTVTPVGAADALSGLAGTNCAAVSTATAGVKTATCTATDNAGNVGTASASFTVISTSTAITNLVNRVKALRLDKTTQKSLLAELQAAQGDVTAGRKASALQNMQDFVNLVNAQRGKKISTANADSLIADAQTISASIQASP